MVGHTLQLDLKLQLLSDFASTFANRISTRALLSFRGMIVSKCRVRKHEVFPGVGNLDGMV